MPVRVRRIGTGGGKMNRIRVAPNTIPTARDVHLSSPGLTPRILYIIR
jgi:hypothetical protein